MRLLFTLFTVTLLMGSFAQAQALRCSKLHNNLNDLAYGDMRSDFLHNRSYSLQLKDVVRPKNQCQLGVCHLYALSSALELSGRQANPVSPGIAPDYLTYHLWLQKAEEAAKPGNKELVNSLGSTAPNSIRLIREVGLIPETAWRGKPGFDKGLTPEQVTEYIRNMTIRLQSTLAKMPEGPAKEKTHREGVEKIKAALQEHIGVPPEKFLFRGAVMTPKEYAEKYFSEIGEKFLHVEVSPDRHAEHKFIKDDNNDRYAVVDVANVEGLIIEALERGKPVLLGYDHNKSFVNEKTGVMSISAFKFPEGGGPASRKQREEFKMAPQGHMVVIVGVDLDPSGAPIKYKIQNSWGPGSGDGGVYHMYRDYFRAYADNVSVLGF